MTSRDPNEIAAHQRAFRTPFQSAAGDLREVLGSRLAAYIAGVTHTRTISDWATGSRLPNNEVQQRVRTALLIATYLEAEEPPELIQTWFQGLDPNLEDRSAARLLREGDLDVVGPEVMSAARTWLVGA